jgi:hypothetical protein
MGKQGRSYASYYVKEEVWIFFPVSCILLLFLAYYIVIVYILIEILHRFYHTIFVLFVCC